MSLGDLHGELTSGSAPACKVCAYMCTLAPSEAAEWNTELSLPVGVVSNAVVVRALARRGVDLQEASVRRHRTNHVPR